MDEKELIKLEKLVSEELSIADSYRHPIPESNIKTIKSYFLNKYLVIIESSHVIMPQDLGNRYVAIFSKRRK